MSRLDRATALRYIDSSVLVAAAIEDDPEAVASIRADGPRLASALTFAEATRAIVKASVAGRINKIQEAAAIGVVETFRRRCETMQITPEILSRVGRRFPIERVRMLDAIRERAGAWILRGIGLTALSSYFFGRLTGGTSP